MYQLRREKGNLHSALQTLTVPLYFSYLNLDGTNVCHCSHGCFCLLPDSLITHGFGTPAVCAALSTFQTVLSEMLNYLDKNSSGKTSGPTDQQINNSSEKTQLRKTGEPQSKDGKTEKTE